MKMMNTLTLLAAAGLATASTANAAHVLTASDLNATFTFDSFAGTGFAPDGTATAGQLPTNAYAVDGLSDGEVDFGGTATTANTDFTRGTDADGGVTTGGVYAFTVGGNPFVGFQPSGSDFNPGNFYINVVNNTGSTIDTFDIDYDIMVRNDQGRSSTFNFAYAVANVNTTAGSGTDPGDLSFTSVSSLDYTSPLASTSPTTFSTVDRAAGDIDVNVLDGQSIVLRFSSADVAGSGSRDELGVDNIVLNATVPEPASLALLGLGGLVMMGRDPASLA